MKGEREKDLEITKSIQMVVNNRKSGNQTVEQS